MAEACSRVEQAVGVALGEFPNHRVIPVVSNATMSLEAMDRVVPPVAAPPAYPAAP